MRLAWAAGARFLLHAIGPALARCPAAPVAAAAARRPAPQRRPPGAPRPAAPRAMASAPPPAAAPWPARRDAYGGVVVDPGAVPECGDAFAAGLAASLAAWRSERVRGVWLRLPAARARHVAAALDAGFALHHAEPDAIMLTAWLPEREPCTLPPNASHQVGVGAFVLNARREVLVVQERAGPAAGRGFWKVPTGLVHAGEDVTDAAEREVLEETGVRARFAAVLALRQSHGWAHGKSDLFFLVALAPAPGQDAGEALRLQASEVAAVRWMPLAEFVAAQAAEGRPLLDALTRRCVEYADGTYAGLAGRRLASGGREDLLISGEAAPPAAHAGDAWVGVGDGGGGPAG